jgi:hypothetical protein
MEVIETGDKVLKRRGCDPGQKPGGDVRTIAAMNQDDE